MVGWRRRMIPAIAAASLLLLPGPVATAVSEAQDKAEEAVLIPGATVFKRINPLYPIIANSYPVIGINFHSDADPRVVDYSQNALAADKAIQDGVAQATVAYREVDGPVVVIGESMGAMVAARLAAALASSPDAPAVKDVRFVLIASPEAGVARYFPEGTYIPLLNYRVSRIPESPYHTTIVIGEYDGWADPPDRPWNVVSAANALLGIVFVHGPPIAAADPAAVPDENITVKTNRLGGTVVTYFVTTENLPLTQAFRSVGIPDTVMDRVDQVLRPIVDAGYRRHDEPGDTRPYLSEGKIVRSPPTEPSDDDGGTAIENDPGPVTKTTTSFDASKGTAATTIVRDGSTSRAGADAGTSVGSSSSPDPSAPAGSTTPPAPDDAGPSGASSATGVSAPEAGDSDQTA